MNKENLDIKLEFEAHPNNRVLDINNIKFICDDQPDNDFIGELHKVTITFDCSEYDEIKDIKEIIIRC